jgi:hypothetical protein
VHMRGNPALTPGSEAVMSFLSLTSPANLNAFEASWMDQPITYLVAAALCAVFVLRFLKRALAPIGALVQAVAAAAVVAVLVLAMLVIAAVTMVR